MLWSGATPNFIESVYRGKIKKSKWQQKKKINT